MLLHYSHYMTLVLQCIYCYTQRATDRHIDCFSIIQVTMTCQLYKLHWFVTFFCSRRFSFFFFLRLHCAQLQSSSVCIRQQVDSHTRLNEKWSLHLSQECFNCLFTICRFSWSCNCSTKFEVPLNYYWGKCCSHRHLVAAVWRFTMYWKWSQIWEVKPTSNPSIMMDKWLDGGQCGEAFTASLLNVIRNTK